MVRYENGCVDCGIHCTNCGRKHTPHFYCDKCGWEQDITYHFEGKEYCIECIEGMLDKVEAE